MNLTPVYAYPTAPGAMGIYTWDTRGYSREEVLLKNSMADQKGISRFHLKLTKLTAINQQGNEVQMLDFPWKPMLKIAGMYTGRYIRTMGTVHLAPGTYTKFKFYFEKEDSSFELKDRSTQKADTSTLEFDLITPLVLEENKKPELIIRFDLPSRVYFISAAWVKQMKKGFDNFMSGIFRHFPAGQRI